MKEKERNYRRQPKWNPCVQNNQSIVTTRKLLEKLNKWYVFVYIGYLLIIWETKAKEMNFDTFSKTTYQVTQMWSILGSQKRKLHIPLYYTKSYDSNTKSFLTQWSLSCKKYFENGQQEDLQNAVVLNLKLCQYNLKFFVFVILASFHQNRLKSSPHKDL